MICMTAHSHMLRNCAHENTSQVMQKVTISAVQVSGLQIVVDQAAIAKALPLAPGTRMALPLLIHAPQV